MVHSPGSLVPSGFASHAVQMLQKVQHGISPIELVYKTHEHWPLRPGHTANSHPMLRISVLDSSFNPPTLAHLALANSLPPSSFQHSPSTLTSAEPYDARMLLLSVRNADKALKPGDATFVQRLEMMRLLLHDMRSTDASGLSGESSQISDNVAVAVVDEPMFVGKSTVLLRFLRARLATVIQFSNSQGVSNRRDPSHTFLSPELTFLLGFDTLIRLISPKYYPSEQVMVQMLHAFLSPDQGDCRIMCAYRRYAGSDQTFEGKALEVAHEFIRGDRIAFIDIGAEEQAYSSSEVRAKVAAGDKRWRQLVTNVISDYITEQGLYSNSKGREK